MAIPSILIIGRPNVGKSTFFNRFSKEKKAIVCDWPGVTRDLNFSHCKYLDHNFILIDSGGIFIEPEETTPNFDFQQIIEQKVVGAIESADLLYFMVDSKAGVSPYDEVIARFLSRYRKKTIIVVNKTDNDKLEQDNMEFFSLGFEQVLSISSLQGKGLKELLNYTFNELPDDKQGKTIIDNANQISVSIIGKPNVGKSTLFNTLLGKSQAIVSNIPGTTRDSIDSVITNHGNNFRFVDTAGLSKKSRTAANVDFYSYIRTLKSIYSSAVTLFLIDASEPITEQDKQIASLLEENKNGIVLVINKWDKIKKDTNTMIKYTDYVLKQLHFIDYAPMVFISADTKQRVQSLYQHIYEVHNSINNKLAKKDLNLFLSEEIKAAHNPLMTSGRGKVFYIKQNNEYLPDFQFFVNNPKLFKPNFSRFLTKRLRHRFGFSGVPITINYTKV